MYDAREVTNWFIARGLQEGEPLTIMDLLKLVYIAHGWSLALYDKPLFHNRIEAWPYGPVVPDIYHDFRPQGTTPEMLHSHYQTVAGKADVDLLQQVYGIYGHMPPWHLSSLTHVEGGPWDTAIKWGGHYAEIPNDLIMAHYANQHRRGNGRAKTVLAQG